MKRIATKYTDKPQEFWIIFTQGRHPIARWLKPHFSHVYLVTRDDYNWLILNPSRLYLQAEVMPFRITDDVPRLIRDPFDSIIHIKLGQRDSLHQFGYFGMLNCVTWTKYILGLNVKGATPYKFYKTLLNFTQDQRAALGIHSLKRIP